SAAGMANWKHASDYLTSHENSIEHLNCMKAWKELSVRLQSGKTIDNLEMALLEAERVRWREVLTRLTAIVQSLAVRNLALRGHTETLFTPSNGHFLKEVELMAMFDPIMKEHLHRVERGTSQNSYLGHHVQNELIELLSSQIISAIVDDIKQAKFFSVILDCTPDISHIEQLSVVIRVVSLMEKPHVMEHFRGFLEAEESTGQNLASMILTKLEDLGIPFQDCRGQSYDNGANMRGKNKGVQQKLYTLFSGSTQRWAILKKHVGITLKMWAETRWESKVKGVEPMRYHGAAVREALIEVRNHTKDPAVKAEAQSLSEEVGSYRFSICTVVWYDMLPSIQHASKLMQSPDMHVDLAVSLLKKTEQGLQSYRKLEVGFFNVVVDAATSAIKERFSTLENVGNKFRVLTHFPSLADEELVEQCEALHLRGHSDLDSRKLVQEIKNFPDLPSKTMSLFELITFVHDKDLSEIYPNFWTALRIALTLPVTVAQAERSFSKLKLIKSYRSTMSQKRLTALGVISINHSIGEQISKTLLMILHQGRPETSIVFSVFPHLCDEEFVLFTIFILYFICILFFCIVYFVQMCVSC
uniref:HAT C-terminal dimerisation domain-containing protein n=1 Tax=Gasterosteus aculeatus TaxID=69293 RepID=G3Q2L3_GASAC